MIVAEIIKIVGLSIVLVILTLSGADHKKQKNWVGLTLDVIGLIVIFWFVWRVLYELIEDVFTRIANHRIYNIFRIKST